MYYKCSWMLHTLRTVFRNDSNWYNMLQGLQLDFKHTIVNTNDIIQYIQKYYEHDLSAFFKQYLFFHMPESMILCRKPLAFSSSVRASGSVHWRVSITTAVLTDFSAANKLSLA